LAYFARFGNLNVVKDTACRKRSQAVIVVHLLYAPVIVIVNGANWPKVCGL